MELRLFFWQRAQTFLKTAKAIIQLGGGYKNLDGLTVSVCISDGSASRYAVPSSDQIKYAALLYPDGAPSASDGFASGEFDEGGNSITFHFKRPSETEGLTIEVFAFAKDVAEADFARETALFSGSKSGLEVVGDSITVGEPITLTQTASAPNGTVNLKIKVNSLENCTLEIDDTTNFRVIEPAAGSSAGYFTVRQTGDEIPAGTYQLTFIVKKGEATVLMFSDSITVLQGMETNTWRGLSSSEIDENGARVVSVDKTFYVRGEGEGWYSANGYSSVTTSDDNSGSCFAPFATIQKAIDTVIAANDGESDYTIYVDGTLTLADGDTPPAHGMADFSTLTKNLALTIKTLSASQKATLNANNISRVMYAVPASGKLTLALENLAITGGKASGSGGGIYAKEASITMSDCKISGNESGSNGGAIWVNSTVVMTSGTISGNTANSYGGGVYVCGGATFQMLGGTISGNMGRVYGGGVYVYTNGTFEMSGNAAISGNKAGNGGGVYVYSGATFTMNSGTIGGTNEGEGNRASSNGGGVYVFTNGTFEMSGNAAISGNNAANGSGGGVYVYDTGSSFTLEGGMISGNTANFYGGGVYCNNSTFTMNGGTIGGANEGEGNTASSNGGGVYVSGGSTFKMTDGTISSNTAVTSGSGVYAVGGDVTFSMSGAAKVAADNDVYLGHSTNGVATISVAGSLTAENPVATITPYECALGGEVLRADGTAITEITDDICAKFALSPDTNGVEWTIVPSGDGTAGILKRDAVYLNSENGDDANSGGTASKAVKTLSKAIELFDANDAQKIVLCAECTLASGERDSLNRAGKTPLTLVRYDGTSDEGVSYLGNLIVVDSATATTAATPVVITNTTIDGMQSVVADSTGRLLYIKNGVFVTLGQGATLKNNAGGGVSVYGTLTMSDGEISGNKQTASSEGAGVYIGGGAFTMSGGKISDNIQTQTDANGAGVLITHGTFTMTGGEISGNKQTGLKSNGGGVYVGGGTFTMDGNATISENHANGVFDSNGGGGVCINKYGIFNMNNGIIKSNSAMQSGGGVLVRAALALANPTFNLSGGTIIGNSATNGSGVCIYNNYDYYTTTFSMKEGAKIDESNDVFLEKYSPITVSGVLTESEVAKITLDDASYDAIAQVLKGDASLISANRGKFTLNKAGWEIGGDGYLSNGEDSNISVSVRWDGEFAKLADAVNARKEQIVSLNVNYTGITVLALDYRFEGLENLKTLELHGKITPERVFQTNTALTSVTLGIPTISDDSFNGCTNLANLTLEDGTATIGARAFLNCTSLATAVIPSSVTTIDTEAFNGCSSLSSVEFESTSGWTATNENENPPTVTDFVSSDTSENAKLLKETYCRYKWMQSE